ncbi:MAG: DUF427 domain-containing protein [Pseudomonadales bacterium]|nr:DUF427 domain-containing protein [Pseudomonadales bacterium]
MKTAANLLLKEQPIQRPDEPRHFMLIKALTYPAIATIGHRQLAYSDRAFRVQEVGHDIYAPVIYFAQDDVQMQYFTDAEKHTECPLKGVSDYYDLRMPGQMYKHAAWSYTRVYEFDERLQILQGLIAFDTRQVLVQELTNVG